MRRAPFLIIFLTGVALASAQSYNPSFFRGLKWRLVGPFRGGRALAVTGVPGQPDKFYFGSVGGGVWETDNAGRTWTPIFDQEPVASIGAIAVAPSNPDVVYVGSGESDMRSNIQQGDGMYKSTNGGKTWSRIGLEDSRQIARIVVDPQNPDTVYVAVLGHPYGRNNERGVFKSTDGGVTWQKILYKGPDVGAIDICMDPTNSSVLFAAMWQTRRPPWSVYPPSNGPGSGLYKTTDGGQSWTQVSGSGFPAYVGRVGIAISRSNPERIYALVDTNNAKDGGVYRSDDGGATWSLTDNEKRIWTRGWYFCEIAVDPKNENKVYLIDTCTYRSDDGGHSFTPIKGAPGGDDYHGLWIDPDHPERIIVGSDQGVEISVDGAKSWSSWYNQPTGQFYHVSVDNRVPYWIYGSQQDSGSMAVPSRTFHRTLSGMDWTPIEVGGESDTIAPDPSAPGVLLGSEGTIEIPQIGWTKDSDPTLSDPLETWRKNWTAPILASPTQPHVFYTARQKVLRTADGGQSWQTISPDLSRETNTVPDNLDPTTAKDDTGLDRRGVVYWIAPSPVEKHLIWAGTDDGLIWVTRDEGRHWDNVTPSQLTPWSKVGIIDASHFDADTAYAAVDRHRLDDNHPYIYRTHDGGKNWQLIVSGLPDSQSVNVVREDPVRKGVLYAGTERTVFVSFDDGENWQSLQLNLPAASIRDIVFAQGDIVVATHGRAIWVLDDASVLRQLHASSETASAILFRPLPAIRYQEEGFAGTPLPPEEPQAQNPPWGAIIDYYLPSAANPVEFTVSTIGAGQVARFGSDDHIQTPDYKQMDIPAYWVHPQMPPASGPGGHRYIWNLRDTHGLVVPPGDYTLEMKVGGRNYSEPLVVQRDPNISATDADIRKQYDFCLAVQAEATKVTQAQRRAEQLAKSGDLDAGKRADLEKLIGGGESGTPDMGQTVAQDNGSLRSVLGGLRSLERAAQSGPAAPSPLYFSALSLLKAQADKDIAALDGFAAPGSR